MGRQGPAEYAAGQARPVLRTRVGAPAVLARRPVLYTGRSCARARAAELLTGS